MDSHLEPVEGGSSVTARTLSDGDSKVLGWDSDWTSVVDSLSVLLLGGLLVGSGDVVDQVSADGLDLLHVSVGNGQFEL